MRNVSVLPLDLRAGLPDTTWSVRSGVSTRLPLLGLSKERLFVVRGRGVHSRRSPCGSPSETAATPPHVPPSCFRSTSTVSSSTGRVGVLHPTADLEVHRVSDPCEGSSPRRLPALQSFRPPTQRGSVPRLPPDPKPRLRAASARASRSVRSVATPPSSMLPSTSTSRARRNAVTRACLRLRSHPTMSPPSCFTRRLAPAPSDPAACAP